MAWIAADCFYTPHSRWVHCFILGCDGEFAVRFKRYAGGAGRRPAAAFQRWLATVAGVTCYYPSAPAAFMRIAKGSPSPGRFVHLYLFKKLPYRIIADPCPPGNCGVQTDCCAAVMPGTVHNTITAVGGALPTCDCLIGQTVPMPYDSVAQIWIGHLAVPGCNAGNYVHCALRCNAGTFEIAQACDSTATTVPTNWDSTHIVNVQCPPSLDISYQSADLQVSSCCPNGMTNAIYGDITA
jgi:hypothetical protein